MAVLSSLKREAGDGVARLAKNSGVVVAAWFVVIAAWIVVGQFDQMLAGMHPAGGRAGGVIALTSPTFGQEDANALLVSWEAWNEQRVIADDRRLSAGFPGPESVLVDTPPGTIVVLYLAADAVLAIALAFALWLVICRRRNRFAPDEKIMIDDRSWTNQWVILTRRLLRVAPAAVVLYLLSDLLEGCLVAQEVFGTGAHVTVQAAAGAKLAGLAIAVTILLVAASVAGLKLPRQIGWGSVPQTILALRLHVVAVGLLVVLLTVLPGSVKPQVLDAIRSWDKVQGAATTLAVFGLAALFIVAAPAQIRRDQRAKARTLGPSLVLSYFVAAVGILVVGLGVLDSALVTVGGLLAIGWVVLSVPFMGSVTDDRTYLPSWVTVGTLGASIPFALWVAVAQARIEPTDDLLRTAAFLVGFTVLTALVMWLVLWRAQVSATRQVPGVRPGDPGAYEVATVVTGGAVAAAGIFAALDVIRAHRDGAAAAIDNWGGVAVVTAASAALLGMAIVAGWVIQRSPQGILYVLRFRRPPIVLAILLLVLVESQWGGSPAFHRARTLPVPGGDPERTRTGLPLGRAIDELLTRKDRASDGPRPDPILVISTSGGGARSAYWTMLVLDCLFGDGTGRFGLCGRFGLDFERDLLAVSGISGGSVGAAMYATSVWRKLPGVVSDAAGAESVWAKPFLDPIFANLLFVDAPNAVAGIDALPDRAAALERAWEAAVPGLEDGLFATQLGTAGHEGTMRFPLLLLNGATIDGGCRFNASVVELGAADPLSARGRESDAGIDSSCRSLAAYGVPPGTRCEPRAGSTVPMAAPPLRCPAPSGSTVLEATLDLADHLCENQDIALSTAALLSARFPVVSPSGALERCQVGGFAYDVDGGLVDSSGASPAEAVVSALRQRVAGEGCKRQIVVLQLDNGYDDEVGPPEDRRPGELRGLASGWFAASGSRGAEERQSLAQLASEIETCSRSDLIPYVRLSPEAHPGVEAPLGWLLSSQARRDLTEQLETVSNQCALASLADLVGADRNESQFHCITGTLSDSKGRALPGRNVCLTPGPIKDNETFTCDLGTRAHTDSRGSYRIGVQPDVLLPPEDLAQHRNILTVGVADGRNKSYVPLVATQLESFVGRVAIVDLEADVDEVKPARDPAADLWTWLLVTAYLGALLLGLTRILGAPAGGLDLGPQRRPALGAGGGTGDGPGPAKPLESIEPVPWIAQEGGMQVWAHQGGELEGPSNTLWALARAARTDSDGSPPADGLEIDVQLTKDRVAVVIHDPTVDDTTDGTGRVDSYELAELQGLNAAARFTVPAGVERPPGRSDVDNRVHPSVQIPTLDVVLGAFPDWPFIIEVKDPAALPMVVDAVRRRPELTVTYVTSLSQATVRELLAYQTPECPLRIAPGWLGTIWFVCRARWGPLPKAGPHPRYAALFTPFRRWGLEFVNERVIEVAHRYGMRVDVWTINDSAQLLKLRKMGVDGVMTAKPHLASVVVRGAAP